jgi:5-formyltetrahydrofolate cyclo-ligase
VDDDGGTPAARKQSLRAELLAARRARRPADLELDRAAVRNHVLDRLDGQGVVAAYVPLRTEPGSVKLLDALRAIGVKVLVPETLADRDLDWTEWGGTGRRLGPEAVGTAGLVLVPALAVARDGTRLGRGGGSYDRALARCGAETSVAALVFDDEVVDHLPREPWDVPVPAAVTPAGWVRLDRNTDVGFDR